jgi:hypothetical protein
MNRIKILMDLRRQFPKLPLGKAPLYVWYKHYYPHGLRKPFYHPKTTIVGMRTAFRYFDSIRSFEVLQDEKGETGRWKRGERAL